MGLAVSSVGTRCAGNPPIPSWPHYTNWQRAMGFGEKSLSNLRRRETRPGQTSEMAIWMSFQIGLQLLTPTAGLDGIPERKIESVRASVPGKCIRGVLERG